MKRIICGKVYDTETATEVASCQRGVRYGFDYIEETLYRKRTGEFFLHGLGGSETKYAERADGGFAPGECIVALSYGQAMEWAASHMPVSHFDALFGNSDGDVVMSVRVKSSTRDKLRRLSSESGRKQGAILDELVSRA